MFVLKGWYHKHSRQHMTAIIPMLLNMIWCHVLIQNNTKSRNINMLVQMVNAVNGLCRLRAAWGWPIKTMQGSEQENDPETHNQKDYDQD